MGYMVGVRKEKQWLLMAIALIGRGVAGQESAASGNRRGAAGEIGRRAPVPGEKYDETIPMQTSQFLFGPGVITRDLRGLY